MTETRTEYVPYEFDVLTVNGADYLGVPHDKFARKGGMVYIAGHKEDEEAGEITSVMVPSENIKAIREYSEEEEVEVPDQAQTGHQGQPPQNPEEAQEAEDENSEGEPQDSAHLPDLTVDEVEDEIDDVNNVDYLEACIEEDDRKTAVDLYESRIEELQS